MNKINLKFHIAKNNNLKANFWKIVYWAYWIETSFSFLLLEIFKKKKKIGLWNQEFFSDFNFVNTN